MADPIVVVGACNIDLITYCPRLPKVGETIHGHVDPPGYGFGGKGANQAVMARKMGSRVSMVSAVGDDFYGRATLDNFDNLGIDRTCVATSSDAVTGLATILVDGEGRNCIVISNGANGTMGDSHIAAADDLIKSSSLVVCQLELDANVTISALETAKKHSVKTFLNTAPAIDSLPIPRLFPLVDIICANEPEALKITGFDPESSVDAAKSAGDKLVRSISGSISLITLGARGCLVSTKSKRGPWEYEVTHEHVNPLAEFNEQELPKVVDTTGAGDCWVGAWSHFYAKGVSPAEAARRACIIASMSVTKKGTQSSYPSAEDEKVKELIFLPNA